MSALCMVLLANDITLPRELFRMSFERQWPGAPAMHDIEYSANLMSFRLAGDMVVISNVPGQLPQHELSRPLQHAAMWPDAQREVTRHINHIMISIAGDDNAREKYRLVTRIAATIIAIVPEAMGVFWPSARSLAEREQFSTAAARLAQSTDPVELWVGVECQAAQGESSSGRTHGLKDLGALDFAAANLPEPSTALTARLHGLIGYVLAGNVVADGDTAAIGPNKRIRFHLGKSALGSGEKLLNLQVEDATESRKRWWKLR